MHCNGDDLQLATNFACRTGLEFNQNQKKTGKVIVKGLWSESVCVKVSKVYP